MILVGIDGGSTKTHALAVDKHGQLVGTGTGGRSNYHTVGLAQALDVVAGAAHQALAPTPADDQRGVGRAPPPADLAVCCLAACDSDVDEQRLLTGLQERNIAERVVCYNDGFAALRAGASRPYGVGIICGTGFNACGIAPNGDQAKLYSLGPLTGDWGGGHSLGEAVFAAAYRAEDGRAEPTALTAMLLHAMQEPDLKTLAYRITEHQITGQMLSKLAPLVFEAAEAGDEPARAILRRQAEEIAIASLAMLRRLHMTDIEVEIVVAGGVANGRGPYLLDTTAALINAECPKAHLKRLDMPPVVGALYLAFDALGLPTPHLDLHSLSRALGVGIAIHGGANKAG